MTSSYRFLAIVSACFFLSCSTAAWSSTTCAIEPSFDCSQAGNKVEQLVCSTNSLAELDNQMARIYQTALENFPEADRPALHKSQQGWLRKRNTCETSADAVQCVQLAYASRITLLQIQGGLLTVPEPVQYICNSGQYDYLTAIFYTQTALPAVVLTGNTGKENWQYTLMLSPSGSGARYTSPDMEFWTKASEATIQRGDGASLQCKEMPAAHQGGV